jgi:hypothetical protein
VRGARQAWKWNRFVVMSISLDDAALASRRLVDRRVRAS